MTSIFTLMTTEKKYHTNFNYDKMNVIAKNLSIVKGCHNWTNSRGAIVPVTVPNKTVAGILDHLYTFVTSNDTVLWACCPYGNMKKTVATLKKYGVTPAYAFDKSPYGDMMLIFNPATFAQTAYNFERI